MSRLDDYQLDGEQSSPSFDTGPIKPVGPRRPWPWIVAALLVLAVALVAYWWFRKPEEVAPGPTVTAEEPRPEAPEEEAEQPVELPALDSSDAFVREVVETLSSHPRLLSWLATDGLVRRFAASVVNISEGLSPRTHVENVAPPEPFTVRRQNGEIVPTAKSFARYDALVEIIAALDTKGTVHTYRQLEPLFDEAYADLGYPNGDFDRPLIEALDHLLATPVPDTAPRLLEDVEVYVYADPKLEALSMAQRHLLRAGPENARRIQRKLAELRRELLATAES